MDPICNLFFVKELVMKMKTATIDLSLSWHLVSLAFICITYLLMSDLHAVAAESNIGNYICAIANNFSGNAGRGIATIGISVIGTLALLGRITWTQALVVGVGCAVLFGAPDIIVALGADQSCI
jgi:type IV secretory pathway VirB2 component (pilin)